MKTIPVSAELLPCPFCGGDVQFHKDEECSGCHFIQCGQCQAFFDFATTADPENECETVDSLRAHISGAWNRRASPQDSAGATAWLPMNTAPRDGSLVRLLVEFEDHATEDEDGPCPTIGANNHDNDGEDTWLFAGWDWCHDLFTQGVGKPIGWLPMLDTTPQPAGQAGEVAGDYTLERDLMGAMHIKWGDFDFIQIQYQWPYTDNASTRRLAERIVELLAAAPKAPEGREDAFALMREALRKVSDRLEAFIDDEMDMPHSSMEVCKGICDAALSAAQAGGE